MKRDVRISQERSALERIGLQTMLLGQQIALENQIEMMNDTRRELGMGRVTVLFEDGLPADHEAPRARRLLTPQGSTAPGSTSPGSTEDSEPAAPRKSKKNRRPGMGVLWQNRMAIIKASGLEHPPQKGFPSDDLTQRAITLLQQRGLPVPGGEEAALSNRQKKARARQALVAPAAAPTPVAKTPANKSRSEYSAASTKADWDLIKRAGLTSAHRPNTELKEKARKILARREKANR